MVRSFRQRSSHQIGALVQAKVSQASSALADLLHLLGDQDRRMRKARGGSRQETLRSALSLLERISIPQNDASREELSLGDLEERLEKLASQTHVALREVVSKLESEDDLSHKLARLEATAITLDRAVRILQAPDLVEGGDEIGQFQASLGAKIEETQDLVREMIVHVEDTRTAERSKLAKVRSQVRGVLSLLQNADTTPREIPPFLADRVQR